jgi:hypothetical protein
MDLLQRSDAESDRLPVGSVASLQRGLTVRFWMNSGKIAFVRGMRRLKHQTRKEENVAYAAKDCSKLVGIAGFSETLLKNHFTLYQGYVINTNKLVDILGQMLN